MNATIYNRQCIVPTIQRGSNPFEVMQPCRKWSHGQLLEGPAHFTDWGVKKGILAERNNESKGVPWEMCCAFSKEDPEIPLLETQMG